MCRHINKRTRWLTAYMSIMHLKKLKNKIKKKHQTRCTMIPRRPATNTPYHWIVSSTFPFTQINLLVAVPRRRCEKHLEMWKRTQHIYRNIRVVRRKKVHIVFIKKKVKIKNMAISMYMIYTIDCITILLNDYSQKRYSNFDFETRTFFRKHNHSVICTAIAKERQK